MCHNWPCQLESAEIAETSNCCVTAVDHICAEASAGFCNHALLVIHLCQIQVEAQLLFIHVQPALTAGPGLEEIPSIAFLHISTWHTKHEAQVTNNVMSR